VHNQSSLSGAHFFRFLGINIKRLTLFSDPILPLRDIVIFPHMVVPLFVGRDKSICALDAGMRDEKCVLLLTQKDASDDDPCTDNLYNIGVLAKVLQLLRLPDGTVKVLVEGGVRVKVLYRNTNMRSNRIS
jgi:ATP-dependent Lon protease